MGADSPSMRTSKLCVASRRPPPNFHVETTSLWGRRTPPLAPPLWCRVKSVTSPKGPVDHDAERTEGPVVSSHAPFHCSKERPEAASRAASRSPRRVAPKAWSWK